ncbi:MAG: MYXO-CTERM sorting domain-containing protein, partial [Myxococcota bacterium]|nr:MYXO-CTERM sorting domain-containing protein [Myxococcota bacterium]
TPGEDVTDGPDKSDVGVEIDTGPTGPDVGGSSSSDGRAADAAVPEADAGPDGPRDSGGCAGHPGGGTLPLLALTLLAVAWMSRRRRLL